MKIIVGQFTVNKNLQTCTTYHFKLNENSLALENAYCKTQRAEIHMLSPLDCSGIPNITLLLNIALLYYIRVKSVKLTPTPSRNG